MLVFVIFVGAVTAVDAGPTNEVFFPFSVGDLRYEGTYKRSARYFYRRPVHTTVRTTYLSRPLYTIQIVVFFRLLGFDKGRQGLRRYESYPTYVPSY